jgi:hypothetical protein
MVSIWVTVSSERHVELLPLGIVLIPLTVIGEVALMFIALCIIV